MFYWATDTKWSTFRSEVIEVWNNDNDPDNDIPIPGISIGLAIGLGGLVDAAGVAVGVINGKPAQDIIGYSALASGFSFYATASAIFCDVEGAVMGVIGAIGSFLGLM